MEAREYFKYFKCNQSPFSLLNFLILQFTGENEEQRMIAKQYFNLIKKTTLPDNLVEIACWVSKCLLFICLLIKLSHNDRVTTTTYANYTVGPYHLL